jgi:predicted nucleotidyltransferase
MQEGPRRMLGPVLAELDQSLGSGYSAVIYGSVARDEYVEGVSDLNLLLLCDRLDPGRLHELGRPLSDWSRRGQPPPLLFEPEEWASAADVFPIEIVDMQLAHEVVRGSDPLAGVRVAKDDLRRALEHELRGKLLRLRQAYVLHRGEPRVLEEVVVHSVTSIVALFRAVLALWDRPVPRESPGAIEAAARLIGTDPGAVAQLWEQRRRQAAECPPALFEGYLAAIRAAIGSVDQFTGGAT